MDELNVARGFSPHFSPSRNISGQEMQKPVLIHVCLPNQGFRMIKVDEFNDVRQIIQTIVSSMSSTSTTKPNPQYYAVRLRHIISKEIIWLPQSKEKHIAMLMTF